MRSLRAYRAEVSADTSEEVLRLVERPRAADRRWLYATRTKRLCDVLLVTLAAPVVVALIGLCAALVMLDGSGPFYSQWRVGRNGRSFRLWKLRTMVPNAEALLADHLRNNPEARREWQEKQKLALDPRITAVGRFLRMSSLDELPQLYNVLRGDMSLVGPRPILPEQVPLYSGSVYYRLRPGLTGPWQVSVRNAGAFQDRVRHDEDYFLTISPGTDLKIILKTFSAILRGTGQ